MAKKNGPFKIDKYNSRTKRVKKLNKPDTIYSKDVLCNFVILIFILTDFFCIFSKWNVMNVQNIECLVGIGVSSAIALDLPFAVAAVALKEYLQGLRTRLEKNVVLWISIIAFALAFGSNFVFSFVTRNLFFSVKTSEGLVDAASQTATVAGTELGATAILYSAAVSGLVPLLTSICSFAFSFYCYDPLKKKIAKMETERIGLQNNLMEMEKAIAEAETKEEFLREMAERQEKLFSDFMEKLEAERMGMEQVAGVVIMEEMETSQEVTKIFRDNEKRMEKYLEEQETPVEQENLIFRGNPDEYQEKVAAETVEELPEDIIEEIPDELQNDSTDEIPEEIISGEEADGAEEQEIFFRKMKKSTDHKKKNDET